jgi:hypothetical protein
MGKNVGHIDKLLNTITNLFAKKVAFFGVLKSDLASKSA